MSEAFPFDRLGRGSRLHRRYVDRARELLRTDERFRTARDEWESFFVTCHGDVFADIPVEAPRTELLVNALYYDFVVDRLMRRVEASVGVTVGNREAHANTDALSVSFRSLHERVLDVDAARATFDALVTPAALREAGVEFLRTLYETVVSRELRLALGEYYTPRGVAELAVDALPDDDLREGSVLDPGCGSGVFNAVCIDRKLAALADDHTPEAALSRVTNDVFGIDLNPVAVKSTKLTYLLSLWPVLEAASTERVELPVFLTDAVGLAREDAITFRGEPFDPSVDVLVGNPPWITWGRLSEERKDRWRDRYVDELDLLQYEGADARLGFANDDVSIPFVWACIHRYLREGGRASFVLKRDVMKGPAGTLLRRLRVGGRPLNVTHVHDFNDLQPFGDQVAANAAVYTFAVDEHPSFPIDVTSWTRGEEPVDVSSADRLRETLWADRTGVMPLDEDDHTTAWIREDAERAALGACDQSIRHGVKDDAQAVFSIDREQLSALEPDLVYPYLKSRHVVKYGLFGHELRLVPIEKANEDNEAKLRDRYPRTYRYLLDERDRLESRSSSWLQNGPFYNVFGLGEYTWSEYKVVWCRLGFKPHFAVVSTVDDEDLGEKLVIPGDHCMFIATDDEREAHFLCALLNSSVYQRSLNGLASEGKASLSKAVVSELAIPEWRETETNLRLAELSMAAHDIVPQHTDVSKRTYNRTTIDELAAVQAEIDGLVEAALTGGAPFSEDDHRRLSTF